MYESIRRTVVYFIITAPVANNFLKKHIPKFRKFKTAKYHSLHCNVLKQ